MHDARLAPGSATDQGAPAWFSFPPSVTVDPEFLHSRGLEDELESMFAHELGHHVLAPSTRIDSLKIRHQLARAVIAADPDGTPKAQAGADRLANLWTDLLVNTRLAQLQRAREPHAEAGIVNLGRQLYPSDSGSRLWWVYCRAYELLWQLPAGTLCATDPPEALPAARRANGEPTNRNWIDEVDGVPQRHRDAERSWRAAKWAKIEAAEALAAATVTAPAVDAGFIADTVRTFAHDPVGGALRFGVIAAPYLIEEAHREESDVTGTGPGGKKHDSDAGGCGAGQAPASAADLGRVLGDPRMHEPIPAHPGLTGGDAQTDRGPKTDADDGAGGGGQLLGVAQTLELYADVPSDAVLAVWYRTQAAAWVRPYLRRAPGRPQEAIPGPNELWELGDDVDAVDWPLTFRGGQVIPGVTTRQRSQLQDDPAEVETRIDLDLYIDSSGSMPSPMNGSAAVLAGSILILSILRGGGRVRVTSFSWTGQVSSTDAFLRDPDALIVALTSYFGSGTVFPLDLYSSRYLRLPGGDPAVQRHVVVLSDDGLTSMFGEGQPGFERVAGEVRSRLTTGTLVLMDRNRRVAPLAAVTGYDVVYLDSMDDAPRACAELAEVLRG